MYAQGQQIVMNDRTTMIIQVPASTISNMKSAAYMFIACQRQFPEMSVVLMAKGDDDKPQFHGCVDLLETLESTLIDDRNWQQFRLSPNPIIGRVA